MLHCEKLFDALTEQNISFFTGVPDSLLKDFCAYIDDHTPAHSNLIAANEGGAIALACGYHMATGKIAVVYLQNSGLGNAINPLISLADPEVYNLPMLLLIGWRGARGESDEPQHMKQGRITESMLNSLEVPYSILSENNFKNVCKKACLAMKKNNAPYAILVPPKVFASYRPKRKQPVNNYNLSREDIVKVVAKGLDKNDMLISTTGKMSRELYEFRQMSRHGHERDFLTVGSMGHCSQIAMGIALHKKNGNVYCLDGDGSLLMHMGSLGIIGTSGLNNFKHVVINNGAHESVGGQPTIGFKISIAGIAKSCGYKTSLCAETLTEVEKKLKQIKKTQGPALLEVRVNKKVRKNLMRPQTSPLENKEAFMNFLKTADLSV